MTTNAGPNSIAFVFRRHRAVTPPALRLRASSGPIWLASASRASSSLPLKALECPQPTGRTLQISPVVGFPARKRATNSMSPLSFPHRG
ncbi:MAG TPA: hypothetical protein VKG91_04275 [Roseiarcus sp.]|nr:hypothetical protein [Roseiarcus sp.]